MFDNSQTTTVEAPISISESKPNPASATDLALTAATARTTMPITFQPNVVYSSANPRRNSDLYLRCSKFFTTSEYAPRLRKRLARQRELIQDATERNWPREIERHEAISRRIRELLNDLGEPCEALDGQSE